ncbi:MAG: hypothetical protein JWO67_2054 [Streptosporangiaceae bacterium]|nr:hypothetical protein [Streptosporangiaceae bacterium]
MLTRMLADRTAELLATPDARARFAAYLARLDTNQLATGGFVDASLARLAGHLTVEDRNACFEAVKDALAWQQTVNDAGDETAQVEACARVDAALAALNEPDTSSPGCLPPAAEATTGGTNA